MTNGCQRACTSAMAAIAPPRMAPPVGTPRRGPHASVSRPAGNPATQYENAYNENPPPRLARLHPNSSRTALKNTPKQYWAPYAVNSTTNAAATILQP